MSFQITEAFKRQYDDTLRTVYQQTESMLEGSVNKATQEAEFKSWDFIGQTSGNWDRPSNSDTVYVNTSHARRGNKQRPWTWADLTDDIDKIQALIDPTSAYIRNMAAAVARAKDERILERLGAPVLTGKELNTLVNMHAVGESRVFNGDGTLAVAGSAGTDGTGGGLTLLKIATIGQLMDNTNIPKSDRHLVCNTDHMWALLGLARVASVDYNTQKVLTTGTLDNFMGFQFHFLPGDRFEVDTVESDCYKCYAYHRDSILMTTGKPLATKVEPIPTKNYSTQIWAEMFIGAVRLQGPGVVQIKLLKTNPLTGLYA